MEDAGKVQPRRPGPLILQEPVCYLFHGADFCLGICGGWTRAGGLVTRRHRLGQLPTSRRNLSRLPRSCAVNSDGRQVPLHFGPFLVGRVGTVHVPAWVSDVSDPQGVPSAPSCIPAACELGLPSGTSSTRTVLDATQFSNYPPLYYLLVRVPTLIATGTGTLYGVRCLGVLLDSALFALGMYLLVRYIPRRSVLVGALLALGPMVLFSSAVVSSSGMETAAGFAAWCGGLCIVEVERTERITGGLDCPRVRGAHIESTHQFRQHGGDPSCLGGARGVVAMPRACAPAEPVHTLVRGDRRVGHSWVFRLVEGQPILAGYGERPPLSLAGKHLADACGSSPVNCGNFSATSGGSTLPAPAWVSLAWAVVVIGVLLYALAVSVVHVARCPLLSLAIVVMPILFEAPKLNTVGTDRPTGRYWLPLAVGLPLVASAVIPLLRRSSICGRGRPSRRHSSGH